MLNGFSYFDNFDKETENRMSDLEYAVTHGYLRPIMTFDGKSYRQNPDQTLEYTETELRICIRKYGSCRVLRTKLKFGIKQKIHFMLWWLCKMVGADFYTRGEIQNAMQETCMRMMETPPEQRGSVENAFIANLTCDTDKNHQAQYAIGGSSVQQQALPEKTEVVDQTNENIVALTKEIAKLVSVIVPQIQQNSQLPENTQPIETVEPAASPAQSPMYIGPNLTNGLALGNNN